MTRDEVLAMAIRDVCELEPADPDSENTVSASVADLRVILERFHALAVAAYKADAERFKYLQNLPVKDAQAFFWNYTSRKQRAAAIDKARSAK